MSDIAWYTSTLATDQWETFRVNANANFGKARECTVLSLSAAATLSANADVVDVDATSGAVTVTLPATPTTGDQYTVRKLDASGNAVTIAGNGKNLNGAASRSLSSQYDAETIVYNGTEWAVVSSFP